MPHLGSRHYQPLHTVLSEVWVLILSLTQIQQIMLLTAGPFPTRSASFLTVTSAYFLEEKNNWHTNPHDSQSLSHSTRLPQGPSASIHCEVSLLQGSSAVTAQGTQQGCYFPTSNMKADKRSLYFQNPPYLFEFYSSYSPELTLN